MTHVLGLAPSLAGTGVAQITTGLEGPDIATATVSSRELGDSLINRRRRIRRHAVTIAGPGMLDGVDLVVIKIAEFNPGPGTWEDAGLWWKVLDHVINAMVPIVAADPRMVKRFATGDETADNAAVGAAMADLWSLTGVADDNQAEALVLAHIGAAHLGMDVPSRAHHAAVLDCILWPDNLPEVSR